VDKVRTVSDTKRAFYSYHTRPVNSIYRRVVEELMVEMHLLSVNVDFRPDSLYRLGVVTSFERFMEGYEPKGDKESIFNALCQAIGANPQEYREEASALLAIAKDKSGEEIIAWLTSPTPLPGVEAMVPALQAIANTPDYKYSRLLAIGLYTLLETAEPALVKDEKSRNEALKKLSEGFHFSEDKIQKDLEIYRGNLDKMAQMLTVLQDALEASRKQREKVAQE
jgi:photosystem II biogenesis protein Psp29